MARIPVRRGNAGSLKAMPWAVLLEMAMVARDRWMHLNPRDRAELAAIVRKSKGRRGTLTPHERQRLSILVRKLEPGSLGRDLIPHARRLVLLRGAGRRSR